MHMLELDFSSYFAPGRVQSIVISMSVCLSVSLYVYLSIRISGKDMRGQSAPNFLYVGSILF